MADTRIFFKMDVGYFRNPKILALLEDCPTAVFIHQAAIAYSREHLTDGVVPMRRVMADVFADPCGPSCGSHCEPQCPRIQLALHDLVTPIDERNGVVHDYGEHNQTRAAVEKAKAAGQIGAAERWKKKRNADRIASRSAERTPERSAERNAEERRGEKIEEQHARLARFDDFWALYPKKKNVGDARKAWAAAVKTTDPDVIIDGLRERLPWFAAQVKPDGDYRPGGGPWLRNERWTDEITQPQLKVVGEFVPYRDAPRPSRPVFHDDD